LILEDYENMDIVSKEYKDRINKDI